MSTLPHINFGLTLQAHYVARRNEARQQKEGGPRYAAENQAFADFLGKEAQAYLHELIANNAETGEVSTEATGDDHFTFEYLPAWHIFQQLAASRGYLATKSRIIRSMSAEELRHPDNIGLGRIGGKPVGVKITLRRSAYLQQAELATLAALPHLSVVKNQLAAEVETRDPLAPGNVFLVNYPLPHGIPDAVREAMPHTSAWRNFMVSCSEMGLQARLELNYNCIKVSLIMSF